MSKIFETLKSNMWKTITIAVTIFSLIGGVWALEDRYANKEVVIASMGELQAEQKRLYDINTKFQESQEISVRQQRLDLIKTKLEFLTVILNRVKDDIVEAREQLRINPGDHWVRNKLHDLEENKLRIQSKIDAIMLEVNKVQ